MRSEFAWGWSFLGIVPDQAREPSSAGGVAVIDQGVKYQSAVAIVSIQTNRTVQDSLAYLTAMLQCSPATHLEPRVVGPSAPPPSIAVHTPPTQFHP